MRCFPSCGEASRVVVSRPFAAALSVIGVLVATPLIALPATAQSDRPLIRLLTGTAGTPTDTTLDMAYELAGALAAGGSLRIQPVLGSGGGADIGDLASLDDIDLALIPTSALARSKGNPAVSARLGILGKLHEAELHILAGSGISTLADLEGKTINLGPAGSGTDETTRDVLHQLGITATVINVPLENGIVKVAAGEIAATALLSGKPARGLLHRALPDGLRLLDIPFTAKLDESYLPAAFDEKDYPGLVTAGRSVSTIAVGVVLAARLPEASSSDESTRRNLRLQAFLGALASALPALQHEGRHPKWRDVNLVATLPGWPHHPVARQWLAAQGAARIDKDLPPTAAPTAIAVTPSVPAAARSSLPPRPTTTGAIAIAVPETPADPMQAFAEASRAANGNAAEQERLFKLFLEQTRSQAPAKTAASVTLP